ncbi:hypothetical protein [Vibrio phage RYC]|nr:hypothetical protein [Vibrio phage RYC]
MGKNNRNETDVPVIVTHPKDVSKKDCTRYTHPSFGTIRMSRVSVSGVGEKTFGSEVPHNTLMRLEISYAECDQHLGTSWVHDKNSVVELYMNPVQFSEFLCNANASPTPCTLRYTQEHGFIVPKEVPTTVEYAELKVKDLTDNLAESIEARKNKVVTKLLEKGTLKVSDRKELANMVNNIARELHDHIPYYTKTVKENLDKMTSEARAGADADVQAIYSKIGKTVVDHPEVIELLMDPERMQKVLEYKG